MLREYDFFVRNYRFSKKSINCFENITLLIKIMLFAKKLILATRIRRIRRSGKLETGTLEAVCAPGLAGPLVQYIRAGPEGAQGVLAYYAALSLFGDFLLLVCILSLIFNGPWPPHVYPGLGWQTLCFSIFLGYVSFIIVFLLSTSFPAQFLMFSMFLASPFRG